MFKDSHQKMTSKSFKYAVIVLPRIASFHRFISTSENEHDILIVRPLTEAGNPLTWLVMVIARDNFTQKLMEIHTKNPCRILSYLKQMTKLIFIPRCCIHYRTAVYK